MARIYAGKLSKVLLRWPELRLDSHECDDGHTLGVAVDGGEVVVEWKQNTVRGALEGFWHVIDASCGVRPIVSLRSRFFTTSSYPSAAAGPSTPRSRVRRTTRQTTTRAQISELLRWRTKPATRYKYSVIDGAGTLPQNIP